MKRLKKILKIYLRMKIKFKQRNMNKVKKEVKENQLQKCLKKINNRKCRGIKKIKNGKWGKRLRNCNF